MNEVKTGVTVSTTCKCGTKFEGTVSTDQHMISCPQCRSYVDVVNSESLCALTNSGLRFSERHILETSIDHKIAKVVRKPGDPL